MPAGPHAALRTLALSAVGLLTARVGAQTCHVAAANDRGTAGISASVRSETAGFSTTRYEGHYQGIFAGVLASHEWLSGEVSLPFYRLVRNGLASQGLGDLALAARGRVFAWDGDRTALGAFLALTLPTGDPDDDLGMGHVMLMPGAWGRVQLEPLVLQAELAYGSSLGASGGHEHHARGESPIVNPMNPSELTPLLAVMLELTQLVGLRAGGYAGFPIDASEGSSRGVAFLGVDLRSGAFGARMQGQLPFLGDPFTSKLVLELSTSF